MPKPVEHRGFMLLTATVLLALLAVLLLSMARQSAARATEARDASVELQRRWGMQTIQSALLAQASRLLDDADQAQSRPTSRRDSHPAPRREQLQLGDLAFDVLISDEHAKANINAMLGLQGEQRATMAVRSLLPSHVASAIVDLRPDPRVRRRPDGPAVWEEPLAIDDEAASASTPTADAASETPALRRDDRPMIGAWPQAFGDADPGALLGFEAEREGLAHRLTLWGDGRLSMQRASAEVLAAVAGDTLMPAQVRRIIAARDDRPDGDVDAWLTSAEVGDQQRARLARRLTNRSTCFSVAVTVEDGWRRHWSLAVAQAPAGAPAADNSDPADATERTVEEQTDDEASPPPPAPPTADLTLQHRFIW